MSAQSPTTEVTSDKSLLERIEQEHEEALSALYDRYGGLVFSEAKRILHRAGRAEEVLEDLFYQVWETAERFDPERGSLAGWLVLAARNKAVARLGRTRRKHQELDENCVALNVDAQSHAAQRLLVEKVRATLEHLPEDQRRVLEYAYFEGMTYAEIAKKTAQSPETVKRNIRNAMEALKKVRG